VESFAFILFFEKEEETEGKWRAWWSGLTVFAAFFSCIFIIPKFYSFFSKQDFGLTEERSEVSLGVEGDNFIILVLILLVFLTTVSSIKILKKEKS
jgi:amino acid permease